MARSRKAVFGLGRRRLVAGLAAWLAPLIVEFVLDRRRRRRRRRKEGLLRRKKKSGGRRLLRRSS
jgi:hypothetical protein